MRLVKVLVFAAFVLVTPRAVMATPISGNGPLGDFIGSFNYDPTGHLLTISLTNTSDAANGGYITALAFNNPGNAITGVTFTSTWLLVRLRGFNDDSSDKVPSRSVPEPASIVLLGSGLAMIAARKKLRRS